MEETTLTVMIVAVKHFGGHSYTNMVCFKDGDNDEKENNDQKQLFFVQTQKAEDGVKCGTKIICDKVEFDGNTETITKENVKGDNGIGWKVNLSKYRFIENENNNNKIKSIFADQPNPVIPATAIDQKVFMGIFLIEEGHFAATTKLNKALKGKITNCKEWKFPLWIPNFPVIQRDPSDTEMLMCRGVFRVVNETSGFQVKGWGEIVYVDKHSVHPDPLIEEKRLEYLPGNTLECTSKDIVECTTVEDFVRMTHGSKTTKHSLPLRMYIKGFDWKSIIQIPTDGSEPYYNATLYGCSNPEQAGIRFKIKNQPTRDIIMLKPASEAKNYRSDLRLLMDVTQRISNKFWTVELMYVYSAKKDPANNKKVAQPPRKRRKLNVSPAPQCTTGYISVVKLAAE